MLKAADEGGYGVLGVVSVCLPLLLLPRPLSRTCELFRAFQPSFFSFTSLTMHFQYNLETITAVVRAAEAKRSPAQILLFPWALHYSPLLIHLAVAACRNATVPIVLHMDHAQSEEEIVAVCSLFRTPCLILN